MTLASGNTAIDVREIAPRERHTTILAAFDDLDDRAVLEIVNDHDPKPLHDQFQTERPNRCSWVYMQSGPDVWRVAVRKLARSDSAGGCCGVCGGA